MIAPLNIVIDTREQTPWSWDPHLVSASVQGLDAGDYALLDDCTEVKGRASLAVSFALERKSLDDFIGTISSGWERFQAELFRMRSFPARIVIVESDFAACCFGVDGQPPQHSHPQITPQFVSKRIAELASMGVCVLFAGNAFYAAGIALRIFKNRKDQLNGTA